MSILKRADTAVAEYWQRVFHGERERAAWPRLEEVTDGSGVLVRVELPGVEPERDVDLSIAGGVLEVVARRTALNETPSERDWSEFHYGASTRRVLLPSGADEEAVTARYRDGILEVRVPVETGRSGPGEPRRWRRATMKVPVRRS